MNGLKNFSKEEIDKFNSFAKNWWNPIGEMKPLHDFNPPRVEYIEKIICQNVICDEKKIEDLSVIDIGCGGGILTESIARLGCKTVGIDLAAKMIMAAKIHAKNSGLKIDYYNHGVEEEVKQQNKYDVVICMEVIEHVPNKQEFVENVLKLVKNDGVVIFSTINRTVKSLVLAIGVAEYVLNMLPRKTHSWNDFVKPSEMVEYIENCGGKLVSTTGVTYTIFNDEWVLNENDMDVNYILAAKLKTD